MPEILSRILDPTPGLVVVLFVASIFTLHCVFISYLTLQLFSGNTKLLKTLTLFTINFNDLCDWVKALRSERVTTPFY